MPLPEARLPDPSLRYPVAAFPRIVFLKAVVDVPNVEIGEFTYYDDPVAPERFYERCVLHHFPFIGDRLVIGRFTAIATGVTFIMGGANHPLGGFSTYPFEIFHGAALDRPAEPRQRGDTVIGNDVWIGHEATILPGVRVGNGAIIGAKAVVGSDVPAYGIAVGNPARLVRRRFAADIVDELETIGWWNWPADKIARHQSAIAGADLAALRLAAAED